MNHQLKDASQKLKKIKLPLEMEFVFEDNSEPYLIETANEQPLKITLVSPFYVFKDGNGALVDNPEVLSKINVPEKIKIEDILITDLLVLQLTCNGFTLLVMPGLYFGWGFYQNNKEILHYHGWDEGFE